MALDHDETTGFLRGESIAAEIEKLAQELKLLRDIADSTSEIARRLSQSQGQPPATPTPPGSPTPTPGGRGPSNDPVNDPAPPRPAGNSDADSTTQRNRRGPPDDRVNIPRRAGARDANGRFIRDGANQPDEQGGSSDGAGMDGSAARAIGGSIVDAARDMGSKLTADVDNVDPAIQAAKEIGGILSPALAVFKPFGRLFGRDKQTKEHRENIGWLRRIWRTQADANRKGGRSGMGAMLGMLMALIGTALAPLKMLGKLLGLGRLLGAASRLLPGRSRGGRNSRGGGSGSSRRGARGGAGGNGGRGGAAGNNAGGGAGDSGGRGNRRNADGSRTRGADAAGGGGRGGRPPRPPTPRGGGLGGLAKGLGKGLLKKIPIIGALFGGAMIASDVMADDDPNLSKDENKKNKWGNVGSGVGGIVGGVLGMLGGPAGAIAGAMVGDALGGMVGEWLSTVDLEAIPGKIGDAFISLKDGALDAATAAFSFVSDGFKGFLDVQAKAFEAVGQWIKGAWKDATDAVLGVKDTVMDKVQDGKDYVADKATSVADAGSNVLYKATGGKFGSSSSNAAKDQLIQAMDAGGITDPKSKAMLMANVDHESGGFKKSEENLNYSAKRLQEVFPKYYKDADSARADAGNPEAIANKVYGGRMGNKDPGDGYKFRGRGALQLTGRAQYEEMGKKLGVDLVNNPELAADPKYSAQIAVQHWKSSGADKAAQAGDMDKARKLTNGGTNGLADVKKKYEETYLAQAKAGDLTPTRRADEMKVAAPAAVGTAVASTMATVASPKTLAGAQAATPIGIMAPTQPRPVTVANSSVPATLAAPKVASYAPAAADASQVKIPSMAEVKAPPPGAGGGKDGATTVNLEAPLSQNVGDRSIAHASAGGIGMMGPY
ncbi:glycoside hydrolase family 19 protein [Pseudomonas sp. TWP3-2]|uniref:glycoside hydrolase family 19 protein n=1 Tax=Pseudomonas sp. TWP3-2 TaxID=2804574 RepID=UPI003CE8D97C